MKEEAEMVPLESQGPRRYRHPEYREEDTIPFFPNYIILEVIVGFIILAGLIVLASLLPTGLEEKADPFLTPEHIKPEWYFLALYQLLKYIPKTAGVLLPIIGMIIVFIWPFIDKKPDSKRQMRIRLIGSIIFTIILIAATIWGEVS